MTDLSGVWGRASSEVESPSGQGTILGRALRRTRTRALEVRSVFLTAAFARCNSGIDSGRRGLEMGRTACGSLGRSWCRWSSGSSWFPRSSSRVPKPVTKLERATFQSGVGGYDGTVDIEVWALAPTTVLDTNPNATSNVPRGRRVRPEVLARRSDAARGGGCRRRVGQGGAVRDQELGPAPRRSETRSRARSLHGRSGAGFRAGRARRSEPGRQGLFQPRRGAPSRVPKAHRLGDGRRHQPRRPAHGRGRSVRRAIPLGNPFRSGIPDAPGP